MLSSSSSYIVTFKFIHLLKVLRLLSSISAGQMANEGQIEKRLMHSDEYLLAVKRSRKKLCPTGHTSFHVIKLPSDDMYGLLL
jgi:hypothetical protein